MGGRGGTLGKKAPPGSSEPTTAWVTGSNGERLHVRHVPLKPLSVCMDEKAMPKAASGTLAVGVLAAYGAGAGLTIGSVTSIALGSITVHEWVPAQCKAGTT